MKRILVCALAAMILMASCLTAFAAPTYTATTSYVTVNEAEYLQVEANVVDAIEGDMITFLAYDEEAGATIEDTEVVYIDQKTVPANGRLTFSYNTDKANLTGVDLKFGTNGAAAPTGGANVPSRSYTVSYNGENYAVTVPTAAVTVITTTLAVAPGQVIDTALYNGSTVAAEIVDGFITIADNADFNGGSIVITTKDDIVPLPAPVINNAKTQSALFTKDVEDVTEETLTVFGYADSDKVSGWGGIIVSKDRAALADFEIGDTVAGVDVYEALYKGSEGEFAVQLVNKSGELNLTAEALYARIYVTNSTDTTYGDIIDFPVAE